MCSSNLNPFSSPKPPTVAIPPTPQAPAAPPVVQDSDPAVGASREAERRRRLMAASANNTLVTGGQGYLGTSNTGGGQLFGQ